MATRIFIQFRTGLVPGEPNRKPYAVAEAACEKVLGRSFDYSKDFLHAQGEMLQENAKCHVLVDCNYPGSRPDLKMVSLKCYRVTKVEGDAELLLADHNVHRGQIDIIPWGEHTSVKTA